MSRKRPSDDVLADYAGGALTPGLSLLVASHLTFDAESRRRVAGFEAIGGVMLADEAPMEPPALDGVLERLNGQVASFAEATPDAADHGGAILLEEAPRPVFPAPLRKELGVDAEGVAWKFRFPGVSEYELDGFEGEEVSLLRAKPGAPLLSHTHSGVETTLVLSGQLQDRDEVYGPGDVSIATDEDDHRPRIIGDAPCICLIVMSGELRFTGTFSRALNLLAE
ncbi:MAG: ChrR family anti-sigma-E factor [Pseudomonadota bacterium]